MTSCRVSFISGSKEQMWNVVLFVWLYVAVFERLLWRNVKDDALRTAELDEGAHAL